MLCLELQRGQVVYRKRSIKNCIGGGLLGMINNIQNSISRMVKQRMKTYRSWYGYKKNMYTVGFTTES